MQEPLAFDNVEARAPARQTCTDHCGACELHFHGLGAFDLHRQGEQGDRHCVDPLSVVDKDGMPRLQVWTLQGYCRLGKGCYEDGRLVREDHPVTIWQTAKTEAQLEGLQRLNSGRYGVVAA